MSGMDLTVNPNDIIPSSGQMLPVGQVAMRTASSYSTAVQVQRPRALVDVDRRLLEEARLMGELAFYGWGAGKDRVEGPSQALAFAAARVWGNCAIEYAPVQETPEAYYYTAYFIDLETGFTAGRPFRQSKTWVVYGKLDEERKADVRFQIGASKAARNVILKALPSWLIDKALEEAKAGVRAKIEKLVTSKGIAGAQDLALAALKKLGVDEARVLNKFGVADRKALDVDRLVVIHGDLKAIERGEVRAEEIYPRAEGEGARPTIVKPRAKGSAADTKAAAEVADPVVPPEQSSLWAAVEDCGAPEGEVRAACVERFGVEVEQADAEQLEALAGWAKTGSWPA